MNKQTLFGLCAVLPLSASVPMASALGGAQ